MENSTSLLGNLPVVVFRLRTGAEPRFEYMSDHAVEVFGKKAVSYSVFLKMLSPEDEASFRRGVDDENPQFTWAGRLGNRYVDVIAKKYLGNDGHPYLDGVLTESTASALEFRRLKQETRLVKDIIAHIPHSVFWKDTDLVYQGCNEKFLKDANLKSAAELIGKNDLDLPWGKTQAEGYRRNDRELMASRKPKLNIEETQAHADGSVSHVITSKVPLFDEAGQVSGILGIYMDISELRQAQASLVEQQAKFYAFSKMAALGEMAAGIAHEINNPLAIISAVAGDLLDSTKAGEVESAHLLRGLQMIDKTTLRIAKIVKGLKSFSRNESKDEMREVPIAKIVTETLEFCTDRFRAADVELRTGDLPDFTLPCREGEISQVLLNLLGNAVDAVAKLPDRWVKLEVKVSADEVHFSVTDSGSGIPPEIRAQIFEPFFTTKEAGKGTGLGLSISNGILQNHGGTFAYNEGSPNTQFVVTLPRKQSPFARVH